MTKENRGWANWEDWFEKKQLSLPKPNYRSFDNYVYLLEAAAAGHGLALGWNGLIDRHLESGTLVQVQDHYMQFDKTFFAVLTEKGKQHPKRAQCLSFLAGAISISSE
jgi:LysR family glycine cleavage system transcriptional activator